MICRYPLRAVMRDYIYAGLGIAVFLPPVALMSLPLLTDVIFASVGALFVLFGAQNVRRHRTRVEITDEGLRIAPGNRLLLWRDLEKLALSYFSVRRDGESGWMELKLVGDRRSERFDSRLDGFDELAVRAAKAACRNGVALDRATTENLAAIGIDPLNEPTVHERND